MVITLPPAGRAPRGRDGVTAMMQDVADAFTAGFRAHPQDWHMMQRVFSRDLDAGGAR